MTVSPQVIGISGVTGAGKTTLATALAQDLNSTLLKWDDFDDISKSPADYVDWYQRGQNYNEWNYPGLAHVLETLKANHPIPHPVFNQLLQPTQYIIFDAPLGRMHQQTGKYIDICVHINVPLDVSLCRRLLRDCQGSEKTKEELLTELDDYLAHLRPLFFDQDLKDKADLIIDGMQSLQEQIQIIKAFIQNEAKQ